MNITDNKLLSLAI